MNKQIKELATKSGFWTTEKFCEGETAKYLEKFAEMIIKDCINVVECTPMKQGKSWTYVEDCIAEACEDIREHFGIEE